MLSTTTEAKDLLKAQIQLADEYLGDAYYSGQIVQIFKALALLGYKRRSVTLMYATMEVARLKFLNSARDRCKYARPLTDEQAMDIARNYIEFFSPEHQN